MSQSCPIKERINIFLKELLWFRLKYELKNAIQFFFYGKVIKLIVRNVTKCYEKVIVLIAILEGKFQSGIKN